MTPLLPTGLGSWFKSQEGEPRFISVEVPNDLRHERSAGLLNALKNVERFAEKYGADTAQNTPIISSDLYAQPTNPQQAATRQPDRAFAEINRKQRATETDVERHMKYIAGLVQPEIDASATENGSSQQPITPAPLAHNATAATDDPKALARLKVLEALDDAADPSQHSQIKSDLAG